MWVQTGRKDTRLAQGEAEGREKRLESEGELKILHLLTPGPVDPERNGGYFHHMWFSLFYSE